ncbi:4-hydroxythreonine-4-phosphate dehydrogenase PdxA [Paracraurococcus sp. NE82]|uniref:4-hydroxythreonine-4-phosphate dehydrogenase PdxA n=2 Tax=Roseicella aquatilis TaxID=2527868 RepID=A0A4R4DQQ5_9PROT|nr:4-hydroxythreonine-4-phosphate dehydrogenase PdxA [Roseicella aquatilis]
MTLRWLILADDLTGAADCGIAFARHGQAAVVGWGEAPAPADAAVLAIDADSRRLSPEAAAARHRALLAARLPPGTRLIKKIDSTLRGQPAAELRATLDALRARGAAAMALVAPAFPATGRTTEDGRIRLNGQPLEATPLWARDHSYPTADLVAVLAAEGLRARLLPLAAVRGDTAAAIAAALAEGVEALVCDAALPEDLDVLARAGLPFAERLVWTGSGGIAAALAAAEAPGAAAPPALPPARRGGILVVVGSVAEASRAAAARLVEAGAVRPVSLPPALLLDEAAAREAGAAIAAALAAGRDVLVDIAAGDGVDLSRGALLAERLAGVLAPAAPHIAGLFATGGETACALLSRLGVTGIRLLEEVEPGVPLGVTIAPPGGAHAIPVMTKAGAFGTAETIVRSLARLRSLMSRGAPMTAAPDSRPIVAITMGDASGIGPEIIMKALAREDVYAICRPLVIGDAGRLREAGAILGGGLAVAALSEPSGARYERGTVDCIDLGLIPPGHPFGRLSPVSGEGAYRYIERATRLVEAGEADAICTAPLSKEALHAAGHKYPGHTELLAHLTGTPEVSMMLVAPRLRVIHVTTHIGLMDAIRKIEPGLVERTIARGHATLVKSGIAEPRIGVCGINPHAGENGLFGQGEEEEKIIPAVQACRARGWTVDGPLPADTLFFRAARGDFDLVVAMYHDQGHGPVKVMGLEAGVNITVGLPVIRTSVDHGTAFDIAGKGIADEGSLVEALRQAVDLAPRRLRPAA